MFKRNTPETTSRMYTFLTRGGGYQLTDGDEEGCLSIRDRCCRASMVEMSRLSRDRLTLLSTTHGHVLVKKKKKRQRVLRSSLDLSGPQHIPMNPPVAAMLLIIVALPPDTASNAHVIVLTSCAPASVGGFDDSHLRSKCAYRRRPCATLSSVQALLPSVRASTPRQTLFRHRPMPCA